MYAIVAALLASFTVTKLPVRTGSLSFGLRLYASPANQHSRVLSVEAVPLQYLGEQ